MKDPFVALCFLIIPEHMENGTSVYGTVGAYSYRNRAAGQAFCDDIALSSDLFLPVLLGSGSIEQDINGQITHGAGHILAEDFFVMKFFCLPDKIRTENTMPASF